MRRIDICSVGLVPKVDHNSEDDSELDAADLEDEPISVEEGDWILATGLLPPLPMEICTTSTIWQRLAEAFQTNMEATTPVLKYLKEFTSVFSKQTFNDLLEPKEWDHTMELIPGSKPSSCKIYPLSPAEQKEQMCSWRRTWKLAGFDPLSLQCHLQCSSLRRRMALFSWSKTTEP